MYRNGQKSMLIEYYYYFYFREDIKEKYEGKLTKEMSGASYEIMSRIMKALVNRKITVPGSFMG